MIYLLTAVIASFLGAVCGIGGGVLIKPALDMFQNDGASVINFLSSCTVFSMSVYSIGKEFLRPSQKIDYRSMIPLAAGAAAGGILGNRLFRMIRDASSQAGLVSGIQACALGIVMVLVLLYTLNRKKIRSVRIESSAASLLIGLALGTMSSFLGVGGGPINLAVLYYFFSMNTKTAAISSIFIILFGQAANISVTLMSGVPEGVSFAILALMVAGGIAGGIIGRAFNKKIDETVVDKMFIGSLIVIIALCIMNAVKYLF
ncbi:MAG: sulfite exporter TauE/SafE family protein [Solobacterium sp.]|nr:sulfite exporter TauE/SafE family protein [Solobacterium sp.]